MPVVEPGLTHQLDLDASGLVAERFLRGPLQPVKLVCDRGNRVLGKECGEPGLDAVVNGSGFSKILRSPKALVSPKVSGVFQESYPIHI